MKVDDFKHIAKEYNISENDFKFLINSYFQEVFYYLDKDIRISNLNSHTFGMDLWTLYQKVFDKFWDLNEAKLINRNKLMFKAHKETYYGKTKKESVLKRIRSIRRKR